MRHRQPLPQRGSGPPRRALPQAEQRGEHGDEAGVHPHPGRPQGQAGRLCGKHRRRRREINAKVWQVTGLGRSGSPTFFGGGGLPSSRLDLLVEHKTIHALRATEERVAMQAWQLVHAVPKMGPAR